MVLSSEGQGLDMDKAFHSVEELRLGPYEKKAVSRRAVASKVGNLTVRGKDFQFVKLEGKIKNLLPDPPLESQFLMRTGNSETHKPAQK